MLDKDTHSLKEISILEIEQIIAEALGKVTEKKHHVKIDNLDFSIDGFNALSKINITISERRILSNFNLKDENTSISKIDENEDSIPF